MSPSRKLRLLPGVLAGLLPWVLQAAFTVLLVAWLGGADGLSRTLGMAGPSIHRMLLLSVVGTVVLAIVLFFLAAGREVPVVVPVLLSWVPWWVGVSVALRSTRTVLEVAASAAPEDKLPLLLQGTGELLCARLLGAWSSSALLLATAGGLFLAGLARQGESQEPTGFSARARRIEAVVVLLLTAMALLAAFESKSASDVFVAAGGVNPADRATLLAVGAQELRTLPGLRTAALAGLVLALLALGRQRLMRGPRQAMALGSLILLALAGAGTLWMDGRPLARMRDALEQTAVR